MRTLVAILTVAMILIGSLTGLTASKIFEMEDPLGDDNGAGSLSYPTDKSFDPYEKLFDLRNFLVWYDEKNIYFDAMFQHVTNPWNAPEGFFHELVDIYVDAVEGKGRTDAPGPNVTMAEDFAWDFRVKVAPFSTSRLSFSDETLKTLPLQAGLLPDGKTIRVTVPREYIKPGAGWRYYVLVGSFDFFGPDNYRQVAETGENWVFGGGSELHPRVIDLLSAERGSCSQEELLGSFDPSGERATLLPVGLNSSRPIWIYVVVVAIVLLLSGGGWFFVIKRKTQGPTDLKQ